jgi:hypothetical protein
MTLAQFSGLVERPSAAPKEEVSDAADWLALSAVKFGG